MRALLLATAALIASPAAAQDHAAHAHHTDPVAADPAAEPQPMSHAGMEHEAMDPPQPVTASDGAGAVEHAPQDHAAMHHAAPAPTTEAPASGPPPRALEGPEHAADAVYGTPAMADARQLLAQENGGMLNGTIMVDRLEARLGDGADLYLWDAQGWYGGDLDRLWVKSEGEGTFGGDLERAEVQALWSHAIGPWFDLQGGLRYDLEPHGRTHAVIGVQGLAPYMFELDAAAFLSDRGDLTARVEAEYDQRITQRLILQPRVELSLAAQDIAERDIGAGFTSIETGLRLRYEIAREFAPYVGIGYEAKLGETADRARSTGADVDGLSLLLGVRTWF